MSGDTMSNSPCSESEPNAQKIKDLLQTIDETMITVNRMKQAEIILPHELQVFTDEATAICNEAREKVRVVCASANDRLKEMMLKNGSQIFRFLGEIVDLQSRKFKRLPLNEALRKEYAAKFMDVLFSIANGIGNPTQMMKMEHIVETYSDCLDVGLRQMFNWQAGTSVLGRSRFEKLIAAIAEKNPGADLSALREAYNNWKGEMRAKPNARS